MPKREGSGRKPVEVSCLFKDIQSTGKVSRVKCTFCSKEKWFTYERSYVKICVICFNSVKQKYVKSNSNSDSELSISSEVSTDYISDASTSSNMTSKKQISFVDNMHPADQNQAKELLARAIFAIGAPSIVENAYWSKFFKFMRPAFEIPTRYQLSVSLLLKEYEKINSLVEEQIAATESVALICDSWSNFRNDSIINFVVTTPFPLLYKIVTTGKESPVNILPEK